jgi:chemotaxis protein CheX
VSAPLPATAPPPLADDVWHVVEGVWESLLGTWPAPAAPVAPGPDWLTAVVTVDGDWSGAVSFSCPPRTALHVSRAMLDLTSEEPDPDREDVEDAVREVVNVLGGNVKALVPGGRSLGLPALTRTPDVDGQLVDELHVGWPGHVARVGVWRADPTDRPSRTNHQRPEVGTEQQ